MTDANDFPARLRRAREAAGISVRAVAERTGMGVTNSYRLETPGRDPRWSTVLRLVDAGLGLEHFAPPAAILAAARRIEGEAAAAADDHRPKTTTRPDGEP